MVAAAAVAVAVAVAVVVVVVVVVVAAAMGVRVRVVAVVCQPSHRMCPIPTTCPTVGAPQRSVGWRRRTR